MPYDAATNIDDMAQIIYFVYKVQMDFNVVGASEDLMPLG